MFGGYRVTVCYSDIAVEVTGGRFGYLSSTGSVAIGTGGIVMGDVATGGRAGCINGDGMAGVTTC
jgi:hypothetical protein